MTALVRALLVALALLTSGAVELAASHADVDCCEGSERQAAQPDCPTGVLCACCPASALPARHAGVAVPSSERATPERVLLEPSLAAAVADIFHPPRA